MWVEPFYRALVGILSEIATSRELVALVRRPQSPYDGLGKPSGESSIKRLFWSVVIGFVATLAITGLYSVSETRPFPASPLFSIGNTGYGFPLNWIMATYPIGGCRSRTCPAISTVPATQLQVDWIFFGFDLLFFTAVSFPLTLLWSKLAGRIKVPDTGRLSNLQDRIAVAGSLLALGSLVLYIIGREIGIGFSSFSYVYSRYPFYEGPVLLFVSLIGISGGILSTWKFCIGGVTLIVCGALLAFFPGLLYKMFFFSPELTMLYVLWISTMLAGGVLSLGRGRCFLAGTVE